MADIATLGLQVNTAPVKDANRELRQFEGAGKRAEGAAKGLEGANRRLTASFGGMRGAAARAEHAIGGLRNAAGRMMGVLSVAGGGGLMGNSIIRTAAEFEKLRSSLETVTGSAERGQAAWGMIQDFATKTPFDLQQVTTAFIRLKALGLDPSREALQSYGNTSSAMGKDMIHFIEAVADAATGQFERLKEFGIRASKDGEQVSFTFQGVTETVRFSAAAIEGYLQRIGDVKFAGAMERQMETLGGAMSNLQDATAQFQNQIGEGGFAAAAEQALRSTTDWLGANQELARSIGAELGTQLNLAVEAIEKMGAAFSAVAPYGQALYTYLTEAGERAVAAIISAWNSIPGAFASAGSAAANAFIDPINAVILAIRDKINTVVGWVNQLRDLAGTAHMPTVEWTGIGRFVGGEGAAAGSMPAAQEASATGGGRGERYGTIKEFAAQEATLFHDILKRQHEQRLAALARQAQQMPSEVMDFTGGAAGGSALGGAPDGGAGGEGKDRASEAERRAKAVANERDQVDDLINSLNAERAMIGASATEQRLYNELKAAGASATAEQIAKIESLVPQLVAEQEAYERLVERTAEAQRQSIARMDEARGDLKGVLHGFNEDLQKNVSFWDAVGNAGVSALERIRDRMMDRAETSMVDALLGKEGEAGGGAFGGWLQGLLGDRGERGASVANPVYVRMADPISLPALGGLPGMGGTPGGLGPLGAVTGQDLAPLPTSAATATAATAGSSTQQEVWNYFANKGLPSHQIAGIMGNVAVESRFDPAARETGGGGIGLFQHTGPRARALEAAVPDWQTNTQGQLDFAWHEMQTTERAALARLRASNDVPGATNAFMKGFERPGVPHADRRLSAAQESMTLSAEQFNDRFDAGLTNVTTGIGQSTSTFTPKFDTSLNTLAQNVASTGNQFSGAFGNALQMALQGIGGMGGGLSQAALQGIAGTAGSGFAGLFHQGGVVGNNDNLRLDDARAYANAPRLDRGGGFGLRSDERRAILQTGERVLSRRETRALASPVQFKHETTVINNAGADVKTRDVDDGMGGVRSEVIIDQMVAQGMQKRKNRARAGLPLNIRQRA